PGALLPIGIRSRWCDLLSNQVHEAVARKPQPNESTLTACSRLRTPMVGSFPACCARAASGHATVTPPKTFMKSRRRIAFPKAQDYAHDELQQSSQSAEMGFRGHCAQRQISKVDVRYGIPMGGGTFRARR